MLIIFRFVVFAVVFGQGVVALVGFDYALHQRVAHDIFLCILHAANAGYAVEHPEGMHKADCTDRGRSIWVTSPVIIIWRSCPGG